MDQTKITTTSGPGVLTQYTGEFWTARQRCMHPLHYVLSYRASFKPELPAYFIEKYTHVGQTVFDPWCGRGTTPLQALMMGRTAYASDAFPVAVRITEAKCNPVPYHRVEEFLTGFREWMSPNRIAAEIDTFEDDLGLLNFYHPKTLSEIMLLKDFIRQHRLAQKSGLRRTESRWELDLTEGEREHVLRFVELLAASRLYGHSSGFFSAYTFPQFSVSPERQKKINEKRNQTPPYREIVPRILKKAREVCVPLDPKETDPKKLARGLDLYAPRAGTMVQRIDICDSTAASAYFPSQSVDLVVASPPFLDVVDYLRDNWLREWFFGVSEPALWRDKIVQSLDLEQWKHFMLKSLNELACVVKSGGVVVLDLGEVKGGKIKLDEVVADLVRCTGPSEFEAEALYVNTQSFTKLAHTFGVKNNAGGTNTNRCLVLRRL